MRIPSPRSSRPGSFPSLPLLGGFLASAASQPAPRPGQRHGRRRLRTAAALLGVAVAASGCYSASGNPGPTPADFTGIAASLVGHGITIQHVVSGEAGCRDETLAPTAISFDARGADQTTPVRVRLYIFRDGSVYTRLRSEVDTCARSYVTNPADYATVDTSPYVAAGAGPWGPQFKDALRTALQQAATPDTVGP